MLKKSATYFSIKSYMPYHQVSLSVNPYHKAHSDCCRYQGTGESTEGELGSLSECGPAARGP